MLAFLCFRKADSNSILINGREKSISRGDWPEQVHSFKLFDYQRAGGCNELGDVGTKQIVGFSHLRPI